MGGLLFPLLRSDQQLGLASPLLADSLLLCRLTRSFFFSPRVHNAYISWEPQLSGRTYSYLVIFLTVLEYELFWAHSAFQIS